MSSTALQAARPAESNVQRSLAPFTAAALLDQLAEAGVIAQESAEKALALHHQTGLHPISALLRLNAVAEGPLYLFYAQALGLPLVAGDAVDAAAMAEGVQQAANSLGLGLDWMALKGLVLVRLGDNWQAAFKEDLPPDAQNLLERRIRARDESLEWAVMTPSLQERVFRAQRSLQPMQAAADDLQTLRELAEEGPTIELVNSLLSQSVTRRASDVHFEPEELDFAVRLRVDGEMQELSRQPRDRFDAVACRLKILANLDIAERRLPQDGRINARVNGESFDIRVSILPGALGESIVLRLLRQERKPTRLQDLGMTTHHAETFERWGNLANGIVLVTGPTGSGKTTTLYTALELANDGRRKIITVEDPVEFRIKGITQLQVNPDIGFTFAAALRSILRHDPDIILVGEIRDEETARIAIQSALTGHMVLSTLHTNSAIGAITRLIDMGLEPFLIGASLRGLMAQRLVRRLCGNCAVGDGAPDEALLALLARFGLERQAHPRRPIGCPLCGGTGYLGRFAIYDLLDIDKELAHHISAGKGESDLIRLVGPTADQGLLRSGVAAVAAGDTTLAEVIRATAGA